MDSLELGSRRDRVIVSLVILAVVLAVVALVLPRDGGDDADEPMASTPVSRSCEGHNRLVIPSQRLTARMLPLALDGQALNPPDDPDDVGWWKDSAKPGTTTGQTLITGHTVHAGGGALNNIGRLQRGQKVRVCFRGRMVDYTTTKVVEMTKEQVAAQAVQLFGQQRKDGRLVLVTCTDWIGPGNYRSNLIVFGKPVDPTAA